MRSKTKFGITAPVPGTPVSGLADFIVKCEKAGVNHFIFRDFSPDRDFSLKTLSEIIS